MEGISQHDIGFSHVTIKMEEEEMPCGFDDSEMETFLRRTGSGFPGAVIKQEEKDRLYNQGSGGRTSISGIPSGFLDIAIKPEEKEGVYNQGSEERKIVAGNQSGIPNLVVKPEEEDGLYHQRCKGTGSAVDEQSEFSEISVKEEDILDHGSAESESMTSDQAVFVVYCNMASKKPAVSGKREKILVEVKQEIIKKHENGMRITDIAKLYGRSVSTIGTILKNKDKIKGRETAKGVTRITKHRPPVIEEVEKLLLLWIQAKERVGDTITEAIICEKARLLHADLIKNQPRTSAEEESFGATRGWFGRFKKRSEIHSVVRHGVVASSSVPAAEGFATEFFELVTSEGFLPQQVFNCDETSLFWKRMPKRTFITEEGTSLPDHKPMKDRLTLLFCANASGDLKIKPLLVFSSLNLRAFKKHKDNKDQMGVFWRATRNAWVTRPIFVDWVNLVFGPTVKHYLEESNLPLKAVLLMDSAPAHPPGLEKELKPEFRFIQVLFFPPNTTPLIQPMDQQVISSFKKLYTRELFRRCVEITNHSRLTLREFWRDHFDIVGCLQLIKIAWDGVSQHDLIAAWRNLWPDSDQSATARPAPPPEQDSAVVQEIVTLARSMGLEVTEGDVCELVEGHNNIEMTTEDLLEMQQDQEAVDSSSEEGGTSVSQLSSSQLKELCHAYQTLKRYAPYHPDKTVAKEVLNMVETRLMAPFQSALKKRQKHQTMERFLKNPRFEEKPGCSSVVE